NAGPPPPFSRANADDSEPEFDVSEDESDLPDFPTTHELVMKDHTKVVSALALDPSGARIVSGSHDYDCKLWDFGGMDWRCKPFKTWEPAGTYYIHDVKYSNDGHQFLVISGTIQPKLYDRDGEEKATYIKGDPYIRDMKNTSGHVAELTSCAWHPRDSQTFITSSNDSTIRIWDVEDRRKQKTVIVVKSKERGTRTKVTACGYSPDASLIGGVCFDGALHLWQTKSNFVRPSMSIEGAHMRSTESGSLVFSVDGRTVLTRGGDNTVKLWDLRAFKKPLSTRTDLATLYPTTNAIFSPDDKYIVTGAGAEHKGGKGRLLFMQKDNLETVKEFEMDSTPVKVLWHSKINQIVTGMANGEIRVMYSPQTSLNGAKLLLNKGPPRKATVEDMSDAVSAPTIITPHALPMFRDGEIGRGSKRKREKDRMDPRKSRRPELPVTGPGKGGRVGASATQHVVQNLVRDTTRDEDPREALLRHADKAEADPVWTAALLRISSLPKLSLPPISLCHSTRDRHASPAMSDAPTSNGHHTILNGNHDVHTAAPDSPATPVDDSTAPDLKIDVDFRATESDMRNLKMDGSQELRDASTTSHNRDVEMTDAESHAPAANGLSNGHSPTIPAVSSSNTAVDSLAESSPYSININVDDDKPPPAKRARKYSDAERASIANTATPPPASVSPAPNGQTAHNGPTTLSAQQHRFMLSTLRSLKKLKDCGPFIHPVDPVAMNIPHYTSIIKRPMSFSVVESKLVASNPAKPDPNTANPRYHTVEELVEDVRLIFSNCVTFNGPEHAIVQMGKRVEAAFDRMLKNLPAADVKPIVKKSVTPTPPPPPVAAKKPVRKASTSVPVIRRTDDPVGRPKREIHPPPPKDLPYTDIPKKRKAKMPRSGQADQLKYCDKILKDLNKKTHYSIAHPFYEPVDWVRLEIPSYPKIIKKPMDLSTMRKKLDAGEYVSADKFHDDFKLMIRNCFTFNPSGTPVNLAGQELQRLFDEKWKNLPPLVALDPSDDEDEELEEEDDEHARTTPSGMIADMETQIENMNRNLEFLKKSKLKEKKKEKKEKKEKPVASTSKKSAPKPPSTKKKSKKQPISDDDVLSFEQKKDLSDTISKLDGTKLERVIQIIHEGVPEIRDSTEEIELEIDLLPSAVLTKLYNFVIRPLKPSVSKRSRTGKGTGTGGLKRKSMDEDVEAEKIRVLEERMALFDGKSSKTATPSRTAAQRGNESDGSSDSSSDDSSGSESE
ncbi:hypothetical protein BXZ70DRAFT_892966, partial [Cristinia sonorae]